MSASSPLISCSKKITQDVDFSQSIRSIIATTYGELPDNYSEEIASLNRCRQDALRGSAGSDVTARDLLYKYFGQLELLELRFPDLRVPFPWADAFTTKQISQLSLAYEKASVIFNIAATLSALASTQNRSSPEGLKRSFNFFRQSAGMFTYINDNFLHAPSTDLSREMVKVLVGLVTAQATEVFIERMTEEKKGAGLKARVCAQAGHIYHSIQDDAKDFVNKGWFSRSWSLLIQCKASYFESLAQYHRATADLTASRHGDALTRLKIAVDKAKDASRLSAAFSAVFVPSLVPSLQSDAATSLLELTKTQNSLAVQSLGIAQKENDLIYHESPTSEASLPTIEKTSVAEPITIQEVYGAPDVQKTVGQDIFIKLVPLAVHESASLYSEEKAKMVRSQAEAIDLADGEMIAALEYMGLPGSLARFKTGMNAQDQQSALADPGPQVKTYVREIADQERAEKTQSMIDTLQNLKSRVTSDLESTQTELDTEERECEAARRQFSDAGFEMSVSASLPIVKGLRSNAKERRDAVTAASKSDEIVLTTWQTAQADIDILLDGTGAKIDDVFARELAAGGAGASQDLIDADIVGDDEVEQMQKKVEAIEAALDRLQRFKRERHDVLKDLKERTQADDISHILILNRKTQNIEPTVFAAELEKFRGHQSRIAATMHHQHSTIQELTTEFKALTEGKKAREIQNSFQRVEKKRRELVTRFQRAFEAYNDARAGASKGLQFYRDLSEAVEDMRKEASRFVTTRNGERSVAIASAQTTKRIDSTSNDMSRLDFGALDAPSRAPTYPQPPRQPSYPPARPTYSAVVPPRPGQYPTPAPQQVVSPIAQQAYSAGPSYASSYYPSPSQQASMPSSYNAPASSQAYQQSSLPPPSQPIQYSSYSTPSSTAYAAPQYSQYSQQGTGTGPAFSPAPQANYPQQPPARPTYSNAPQQQQQQQYAQQAPLYTSPTPQYAQQPYNQQQYSRPSPAPPHQYPTNHPVYQPQQQYHR